MENLMQCTKPVNLVKGIDLGVYPAGLTVPCGKCLSCRISKRREWTLRILHELSYHDKNVFLTLTYTDEHLPENNSLQKAALQKFFKRLRKNLQGRKIKYFAVGEYGDDKKRPHYHAIVHGLGLTRDDKIQVIRSWDFADWNVPSIYNNSFAVAERQSIQYVVGYLSKIYTGPEAQEQYADTNREAPFRLVSQGIGKRYCKDNTEKFFQKPNDTLNGHKVSLPRYYVNQLGIDKQQIKEYAVEKEKAYIKNITGKDYTVEEAYRSLTPKENVMIQRRIDQTRLQKHKNLTGKINLAKARKDI